MYHDYSFFQNCYTNLLLYLFSHKQTQFLFFVIRVIYLRQIAGVEDIVSTFETVVGQPYNPTPAGNGGLILGLPVFPSKLSSIAYQVSTLGTRLLFLLHKCKLQPRHERRHQNHNQFHTHSSQLTLFYKTIFMSLTIIY